MSGARVWSRARCRIRRRQHAPTFLQTRPEENDYAGWHLLVHLLLVQGRIEDVRTMAGDNRRPFARVWVAGVFAEQGRIEELRALSAHGYVLSHALVGQGRVDEAVKVLDRAMVDANHSSVHQRLAEAQADLLIEHGRIGELRTRAETGHRAYGVRLAAYLAEPGRTA